MEIFGNPILSPTTNRKNKKPSNKNGKDDFMENSKEMNVNGESIRLRLKQDMKKWLFEKSAREKRAVSDIMRSLISAEMEKEK